MSEFNREQTCVHESGHIVFTYIIGIPGLEGFSVFFEPKVIPLGPGENRTATGRTDFDGLPTITSEGIDQDPFIRELAELFIPMKLAGKIAEGVCGFIPNERLASIDKKEAEDIADMFGDGVEERLLEAENTALKILSDEKSKAAIWALVGVLKYTDYLDLIAITEVIRPILGIDYIPFGGDS